jgi:hypothetical protein
MTSRSVLWIVPLVFYILFAAWYTDFGGPLSSAEIDVYLEKLKERGVNAGEDIDIEAFMRNDSGGQFLMVNIIDLTDSPVDVEGANPGETAEQLMGRYMAYMFPALLSRACHPTFMGSAVHRSMDLVGIEGAEQWEQGALMRYRSRRTFMDIVANGDQADAHKFKVAALEKTIAYPVEPRIYLADLRFVLALVLLSVTALLDIVLYGTNKR